MSIQIYLSVTFLGRCQRIVKVNVSEIFDCKKSIFDDHKDPYTQD